MPQAGLLNIKFQLFGCNAQRTLACPHKAFCHMTEDTGWANQITSLLIISDYWAMLQWFFHTLFCYILPFRQGLSYKSSVCGNVDWWQLSIVIVWCCLVEAHGVLARGEGKAWIHVFMLSFTCITLKHLELQSSNGEQPLPILSFEIDMYTF